MTIKVLSKEIATILHIEFYRSKRGDWNIYSLDEMDKDYRKKLEKIAKEIISEVKKEFGI